MKIKSENIVEIGGIEFIKIPLENDMTAIIARKDIFKSKFGESNDYCKSPIKAKLESEILPKIEADIGEENIFDHTVDLLALDGSDEYGTITCKISLPTLDFYRANFKILIKESAKSLYWLITPWSTINRTVAYYTLCVSPVGNIRNYCRNDYGVRPFLILKSDIFKS